MREVKPSSATITICRSWTKNTSPPSIVDCCKNYSLYVPQTLEWWPTFGVCTSKSCNDITKLLMICTFERVALSINHELTQKNPLTSHFHVNVFVSKTQMLLSIWICAFQFVHIELKLRVVGFYPKCTLVATILFTYSVAKEAPTYSTTLSLT